MKRLTQGNTKSQIVESSIHHCGTHCIVLDRVKNIQIKNNVIASASNFHIQFVGKDIYMVTVTYNLMIDAHKNPHYPEKPIACL